MKPDPSVLASIVIVVPAAVVVILQLKNFVPEAREANQLVSVICR
jgi:hypothetical protein